MGLFVNWNVYVLKACLGFIVGHLLYEVFFTLTSTSLKLKTKQLLDAVTSNLFHLLGYELVIIILCHYVCHQVAEELHSRADKNKLDKDDFIKLASRVEEFTLRFLDPLKYEENERQYFFSNPETDFIVGTALRLKQKKVIVKRLSSSKPHITALLL